MKKIYTQTVQRLDKAVKHVLGILFGSFFGVEYVVVRRKGRERRR